MTYPAVSCMCLTYGRSNLLEEAIQSFLNQDYAGEKELVILNDLKEQTLIFDHPEVRIINLRKRAKPLGHKRNLCAQACTHDVLFPWDDDDIYLSNRISYSIEQMLARELEFFKPDRAYFWNDGNIDELSGNSTFHAQSCFTRKLFDAVGGYADMGSGEDQEIESRFSDAGVELNFKSGIKDYYYIYRWSGVDFYHISAFGEDSDDKPLSGEQKVGQIIKTGLLNGTIPSGEVVLKPHWNMNYQAQKRKFDAGSHQQSANISLQSRSWVRRIINYCSDLIRRY